MTITQEEKESIKGKTSKPMLWLPIVSMCMIFGGLTSAYIARRAGPGWLGFELPKLFYVSTAIIIISSFTMIWAVQSARKDNFFGVKAGVVLTFLLGIVFIVCQFKAGVSVVPRGFF